MRGRGLPSDARAGLNNRHLTAERSAESCGGPYFRPRRRAWLTTGPGEIVGVAMGTLTRPAILRAGEALLLAASIVLILAITLGWLL